MTKNMPHILVAADKLIIVIADDGGYKTGECIACGEIGSLSFEHRGYCGRLGFPYYAPNVRGIIHKKDCPLGSILDEYGKFKKWSPCDARP